MGKCIFKSSTLSRMSLLSNSLVLISDVSQSWYLPSKLHGAQVQPASKEAFHSSNAPMPTYSAARTDKPAVSGRESGVVPRSNITWYVPSHLHEAGSPVSQSYMGVPDAHTDLSQVILR